MKKVFKIIIINLVFLFCILTVADYAYFKYIYRDYVNKIENEEHRQQELDGHIRYKTFDLIDNDNKTTNVIETFLEKEYYHEVIVPENNQNLKPPILLFGDSYTFNYHDQGLQYLLANYTNRPVFNFAFWGWSPSHMYYLTQKELLYKIIAGENFPQPEYAVYTYIRDHVNRLDPIMDYFVDIQPYLTYENKNGKIEMKKYSFFHKLLFRSFTYRYILKKHCANNKYGDYTQQYEMVYNLITESKKELQKHYPNIKFIVLEYSQEKNYVPAENEMFNKLKQNGIQFISTKDLTKEDLLNPKYTDPDGYHPNPAAWELIVPVFAKNFNSV